MLDGRYTFFYWWACVNFCMLLYVCIFSINITVSMIYMLVHFSLSLRWYGGYYYYYNIMVCTPSGGKHFESTLHKDLAKSANLFSGTETWAYILGVRSHPKSHHKGSNHNSLVTLLTLQPPPRMVSYKSWIGMKLEIHIWIFLEFFFLTDSNIHATRCEQINLKLWLDRCPCQPATYLNINAGTVWLTIFHLGSYTSLIFQLSRMIPTGPLTARISANSAGSSQNLSWV